MLRVNLGKAPFLDFPQEIKGGVVHSDKNDRKRRDIFVSKPNNQELPDETKVKYHGREYTAELSWRTGKYGQSIPVYEFYVKSPYYESG